MAAVSYLAAAPICPGRANATSPAVWSSTEPHKLVDKGGYDLLINGVRGYLPASKLKVYIELAKSCIE